MKAIKTITLALTAIVASTSAFADATCQSYPQNERIAQKNL
ncbi:hypothetical protein [Moraxella sp. RCAD0137]|nr:hypothetical protein [Moraxella sp. RCAD0137]